MWVPTQEKGSNSGSSDGVDAFNIKEQRQPRETALLFPLYSWVTTGRCRPFQRRAIGGQPGEGVCVFELISDLINLQTKLTNILSN